MKLKHSDGKTGTREWTALIAILIGIFSTDMTPSILFPVGKSATWMFPIVWIITMAIPLLALLSILKLYENKGLIDIIYHLTGKYFGFLISITLSIILFVTMISNSRSYVDIMRGVFLPTTPMLAIYLLVIGTSYFIASRGFETIGRVSYIIILFIVVSNTFLLFLIFTDLNINNLFPLWGPGVKELVKNGVTQISIIAEIILVSVFYKYSRNHKDYKIGSFAGLGLGLLQFILFLLAYTMIFGSAALEAIPYPFQQLTKIAGIERFFTNFSSIYLFFWLSASILKFSFYLYILSATFAYTVKLNEFEPLILPFAGLTIIVGLIPKNPAEVTLKLRGNYLLKQSWLLFFLLPLILWGIAYLKGEFKK